MPRGSGMAGAARGTSRIPILPLSNLVSRISHHVGSSHGLNPYAIHGAFAFGYRLGPAQIKGSVVFFQRCTPRHNQRQPPLPTGLVPPNEIQTPSSYARHGPANGREHGGIELQLILLKLRHV